MDSLVAYVNTIPSITAGASASLLAGLATGLGAVPILVVRRIPDRTQNVMLGFGAGVMLAASFFSLILPALETAEGWGLSASSAALLVVSGTLIGALGLGILNEVAPHEHFILGREGAQTEALKRIWLFIIAITIHNLPEGLAVGVGFGGEDRANAVALAIGIGLQNMPEGLAVAAALVSQRYGRGTAVTIALLTGLVEPVGGLVGVSAVSLARAMLPWGLAFAAGAMIFVVSDEIIPETQRKRFKTSGTFGLMIGFAVMMFLDASLG